VSYGSTKELGQALAKPMPSLDSSVARILVEVSPDHEGVDSLFFRVVLKNDLDLTASNKAAGKRLQRIATALCRRAADHGAGFAYVSFMLESELPRSGTRKTA
jgi:hypothetical protein